MFRLARYKYVASQRNILNYKVTFVKIFKVYFKMLEFSLHDNESMFILMLRRCQHVCGQNDDGVRVVVAD